MLPLLLAANPGNWGKPGRLTTAEALAAALYLAGRASEASEVLGAFRWGRRFFEVIGLALFHIIILGKQTINL